MNRPIIRLFGVIVVLFTLLIIFTSRWTVFQASSLNNNPLNVRTLVADLKIKRGRILANDGTVLAKSVPAQGGTWGRYYPTGNLFSQPVGYSFASVGRAAGLEEYRAAALRGLPSTFSSVFGQLSQQQVGDDVITNLDPAGQRAAQDALAGQAGSVVALDPQTGAVKVMYSNPSYNDNKPDACKLPGCQVNKVTQGQYAPGSTFKIVTSVAAIDSGEYTPQSVINGKSPIIVSGVPLENDGNQDWGPQTLTTAMTYSINTIFAQVAEHLGRKTMTNYMQRFGFYSLPPLDYPSDQMTTSKPVDQSTGRPYPPASPREDIGRIGIGEGGLQVTPLQMAMVAAAVANHGTLMAPHLTNKIVDQDGRTVETIKPTVYNQVMTPTTAREVTQMMEKVVEEGTGTAVQLGGISVAGKTGTAQIGPNGSNLTQPSFVAFAPADNPKIAIDVTIDRSQGGFGGTVAAPIAKAVLQVLLSQGG